MKNILFFIILIFSSEALLAAPLDLASSSPKQPLGLYLELMTDPEGQVTIEMIQQNPQAYRFLPSLKEYPKLGRTSSVHWARLKLFNSSDQIQTRLLEMLPIIHQVIDIFELEQGRLIRHTQLGALVPFRERSISHPHPLHEITLAPGQVRQYYFRVKTVNMKFFFTLHHPQAFLEYSTRLSAIQGMFTGSLVLLVIYNFFLFLGTRDRTNLYYSLMVVCSLVFTLGHYGWSLAYLWQDSPLWARFGGVVLVGGINILHALFSQRFLFLHKESIWIRRWIYSTMLLAVVPLSGIFFLHSWNPFFQYLQQ